MFLHACFSCHLWRQITVPWICIRKLKHSALYVTGDKASQAVSVLTPHIDMTTLFQDLPSLERNISLRGMKLNVYHLSQQWQVLQNLISNKLLLERRRNEIAELIKGLKNTGNTTDVEKYRLQGKDLRNELKTVMKRLWSLEENVILKSLLLPNDLNPDTPLDSERLIYEYAEVPRESLINHIDIGEKADVLQYLNPTHYYFKGTAALYEWCVLQFFANELLTDNFFPISNADFARSVIVEGVGMDFSVSKAVFTLKDITDSLFCHNREHLVGGASLFSFCAYHAKHVIQSEFLPLKYFCVGNQYKPVLDRLIENSLFDVCQSSVVEIFIVVEDSFDAMMAEFHFTLNTLIKLYNELGYHFRIVYLPPIKLKPWESLHASIQLYSPYIQSYIEVGHLATCDTYISKRLLMYHESKNISEHKFMRIVSGTAVDLSRLLGCVLENDPSIAMRGLTIPDPIKSQSYPGE